MHPSASVPRLWSATCGAFSQGNEYSRLRKSAGRCLYWSRYLCNKVARKVPFVCGSLHVCTLISFPFSQRTSPCLRDSVLVTIPTTSQPNPAEIRHTPLAAVSLGETDFVCLVASVSFFVTIPPSGQGTSPCFRSELGAQLTDVLERYL